MGVRSTSWGGPLWHASFCMAINYNEFPSANKKNIYINYFNILGSILPCQFCRSFYEQCKIKLPLENFLDDSTLEYPVMYWLYLLKDLVNKKLIYQENQCFLLKSKEIDNDPNLSDRAKSYRKTKLRNKIFYTQPSPPFETILAQYIPLTNSCETAINKTLQSCRHLPNL